jgi:hypothetical protein
VTDRKAKAKGQKKGSQMCLEKGQLRAVHRRWSNTDVSSARTTSTHTTGRESANDVRIAVRNAETAPTSYAQCSDACEQQVAITRIM